MGLAIRLQDRPYLGMFAGQQVGKPITGKVRRNPEDVDHIGLHAAQKVCPSGALRCKELARFSCQGAALPFEPSQPRGAHRRQVGSQSLGRCELRIFCPHLPRERQSQDTGDCRRVALRDIFPRTKRPRGDRSRLAQLPDAVRPLPIRPFDNIVQKGDCPACPIASPRLEIVQNERQVMRMCGMGHNGVARGPFPPLQQLRIIGPPVAKDTHSRLGGRGFQAAGAPHQEEGVAFIVQAHGTGSRPL